MKIDLDHDFAALDSAVETDKHDAARKEFGGDKPAAEENGFVRWMKNLPRNIDVGLVDAAINTFDAVADTGKAAGEGEQIREAADKGAAVQEPTPHERRMATSDAVINPVREAVLGLRKELAAGADGTSDHITQAAAQFMIPFMGWSKLFGGLKAATTVGTVARAATAESATIATAFDPHAGRLADLVEYGRQTEGKFADTLNVVAPDGSALNAYIDYMSSREDESDAEGRFKNVIDGLAGSAAVAGLLKTGALTFRAARRYAESPIELPEIGAPEHLTGSDMLLPDIVAAAKPVAGTPARGAFEKLLENALRREAMESQGRNILDDMVEAGETPKATGERFWRDTYYKLNAQTQQRFQRYAKSLGFEPGQTLAVNADGSAVVAKDWQEVGEFLLGDLPKSADQLEGIERGFVSLMKWANTQADEIAKQQHISTALTQTAGDPQAALVHLTEGADNVLDDVERKAILAARDRVARGAPEQGITVVPTSEGHTVVVGKQPQLTFLNEEDAASAVADAQKLLGTNFQVRAAAEHAKASDANFATLHSFSRVLKTNVDRPVSTHSLLSALERNLKGDTEHGAFYKELLGRLVRKKVAGMTTVSSKPGRHANSAGHYAHAMNAVELYDKAFKDTKTLLHTFTHEAVHAATVHEMNASARVTSQLERLRKATEKSFEDEAAAFEAKTGAHPGRPYGFTNAAEFVAEIEANPEFRKSMQETKLPEGGTAWEKYLETIAGILGLGSLVATPAGLKEFSKLMMGPKQEEEPSA